jgi:uncharacterized protein (DUF58 family)
MRFFPFHLYRLTTAMKFWLFRRILPSGRGALIAAVISATMLMGSPITPLYQLFALLLGLCSVGLIWSWCRRARLAVKRQLPRQAAVGAPLRYELLATNRGRTLPHWALQETVPDPRPSATQFAAATEPGEARRNRFDRALGFHRWQWLLHQNQMFLGGTSPSQDSLAPGATARLSLTITPQHRGCLVLDDLRVLLPDPFRFFQRARRVVAAHDEIIVLPRRYRLPALSLISMSHRSHEGDLSSSQKKGQHGEFASLREYRRGDPPRLIHQKSWARLGRPVVVEVEELHLPRFALVLDCFARGLEPDFEIAVSIAASLITDSSSADTCMDRLFLSDPHPVMAPPHSHHASQKLLEALARAHITEQENFPLLQQQILRHAADLSGMVAIFTGWSEARASFLAALEASGLGVLAIAVCPASVALPQRVRRIRPHHVEQDLMHLAKGSFASA